MKYLSFILLCMLSISCQNTQEHIYPEYRSLRTAVYASAIIQPDSLYEVYTNVQGLLQCNLVTEGDTIITGTPIAQLIDTKPQLDAENARLLYTLSRKQYEGTSTLLHTIEQEIYTARLRTYDDSLNFARQERLWKQNIGSKAQYEAKKLTYENSKTTLSNLKIKRDRTQDELQSQSLSAQNRYQSAVTTKEDFTINSNHKGKVYAVYKNPGESVSPQTPIALIGSAQNFLIEMLVDEVDIVQIKQGQEIVLTLDAYPDDTFTATVTKIYPAKNSRNQTFLVEGRFEKQPITLYAGLAGEANIIVSQKENALVIPKRYLTNGNQVKTKQGLITITKGEENTDYIEVISGLDTTTQIILPD